MLIQRISNINNLTNIAQAQSSLIILLSFLSQATLGLPSIVQNLRLNKIDIGQFLHKKYRLIGARKTIRPIKVKIKCSAFLGKIISATANAAGNPAAIAHPNRYGLCSSVKILPSLLAKVRVFINFVLLNMFNINGTPIRVSQKRQYEKVGGKAFTFFRLNETAIPKLIPNQKTKVQIRSLLSHFSLACGRVGLAFVALSNLIKSCIICSHFGNKTHFITISKIYLKSKWIITLCSVVVMFFYHDASQAAKRDEILDIIEQKERRYSIPPSLLLAIIKTESNLKPFALNINGKSFFCATKAAAIRAVNNAISSGITNIDIGLAQINYRWHGENFTSVDSMLSPELNINYAAELLGKLKLTHGDWHKALRYYHSAKPIHHKAYSRKVVMCWLGVIHH